MCLGTARKVNVAKMAEIVIQIMRTSKAPFTGLVLKAADARRPCFSGCAPSNVSMTIHTIQRSPSHAILLAICCSTSPSCQVQSLNHSDWSHPVIRRFGMQRATSPPPTHTSVCVESIV